MKLKKVCMLAVTLASAFAFTQKVDAVNYATLPTFKVTLNGTTADNTYSKYPLIVYNDITYFPMTYQTSRFLGIETNWNTYSGLTINKTDYRGPFDFYKTNYKNADRYPVEVPNFRIVVNGKEINNKYEQYPLLVFRDVTYFPMTWRFCVDEFGWQYNYNSRDGLVINSNNVNKKPQTPKDPLAGYWDKEGSIYYNGSYYLIKTNGVESRLYEETTKMGKTTLDLITDKDVKSFKQDGNKLVFSSGEDNYVYDMDTNRLSSAGKALDVKDGKIFIQGNRTYYVSAKDDELYTDRNESVNRGIKVDTIEKKGDYLLVIFRYDYGVKYNLMVIDKYGEIVYRGASQGQNVEIKDGKLTYFNTTTMRTETIRL